MKTDVLVAGAGPNGLLMACELALAGVRPVVLERLPERATRPKANGLVGRVVPALDYRGLYETLSGNSSPPRPVPGFQFGALPLPLHTLDSNPMYILPIPQHRLEELLQQRAAELGVTVRRGHDVLAVSQGPDEVTVDVHGPDGGYRLTARFLVAADGGRSTIRKQLGIGFPGVTDNGFIGRSAQVAIDPPVAVRTGELDIPGLGRLQPATFTRTDTGLFAFGMFQPGLYRVGVHEWTTEPVDEDAPMTMAELRATVHRVLGYDLPMREPADGQPAALRRTIGVNSRQAERYRHGRVFLIGDAAHVHSAIGGPGLNLGMQDVLNLAWKLAGTINGWAPEELLDTFETERYPVGQRVIMHTRAQMALVSPGPNITALRELLGELLQDTHTLQRIADLMTGADVAYPAPAGAHPMTGRWMPDLPLRRAGRQTRVAELLHPARPVLLDLADRADLVDAAKGWTDRVDVVAAGTAEPPADAVLIRPDGYVAWASTGTSGDADGLRLALRTWFGSQT